MKVKFCYCGGRYASGSRQRDDCPRATLGHGCWHVALPKLRALNDRGELFARVPDLDSQDLKQHVGRMEVRIQESRLERIRERRTETRGRNMVRRRDASQPIQRRWPSRVASSSRPELPLLEATQQEVPSSSKGNPFNIEAIEDDAEGIGGIITPDDLGDSDVPWIVIDSDESDASILGLRHTLHEIEEGSEISAASSDEDDEMAVAEREAVVKWRTDNEMLDDMDFAYCFVDFDEAYISAGRAVSIAWSRARLLAEPAMVSDMAKVSKVDATTTKFLRVDEQRKAGSAKRRKTSSAAFLRQPGKGTEVEEEDEDKLRFVEPLAQLMIDVKLAIRRTPQPQTTKS